uniref:Uncharacterized protein n=1 Tax=Dendroctonus ponderosae TaxID=77166 RepID=J3JYS7_DENPD|nr:unknown [Dendroctonus ponderosae]
MQRGFIFTHSGLIPPLLPLNINFFLQSIYNMCL